MSTPSETNRGGFSVEKVDSCHNGKKALEVLGDRTAVRVLKSLTEQKSTPEISEECGIPLSTAYRKVNELEEAGLIHESTPGLPNDPVKYTRAVEGIFIALGEDLNIEYFLTE
ncbi:ArsR/SmtB family transcription factor [Halobacterium hubeiense]|uniref:ArsR/SmtB family transcription factor n=1 Tax=Halobacterium hubeiense TaxID=1407499 RepID=UPI0015C591DD|nr:helix-turn-helix domain-containing protein [Halobacterium hubeiense]